MVSLRKLKLIYPAPPSNTTIVQPPTFLDLFRQLFYSENLFIRVIILVGCNDLPIPGSYVEEQGQAVLRVFRKTFGNNQGKFMIISKFLPKQFQKE